jgi:hypothetical protein
MIQQRHQQGHQDRGSGGRVHDIVAHQQQQAVGDWNSQRGGPDGAVHRCSPRVLQGSEGHGRQGCTARTSASTGMTTAVDGVGRQQHGARVHNGDAQHRDKVLFQEVSDGGTGPCVLEKQKGRG